MALEPFTIPLELQCLKLRSKLQITSNLSDQRVPHIQGSTMVPSKIVLHMCSLIDHIQGIPR
jgi:hypothetical protein